MLGFEQEQPRNHKEQPDDDSHGKENDGKLRAKDDGTLDAREFVQQRALGRVTKDGEEVAFGAVANLGVVGMGRGATPSVNRVWCRGSIHSAFHQGKLVHILSRPVVVERGGQRQWRENLAERHRVRALLEEQWDHRFACDNTHKHNRVLRCALDAH